MRNELPNESSKENREASQLPTILNKVSLNDFSGVVEYGQVDTEKSSTRIELSSQSVEESSPKIPQQEIVQSDVSHPEPQEVNIFIFLIFIYNYYTFFVYNIIIIFCPHLIFGVFLLF